MQHQSHWAEKARSKGENLITVPGTIGTAATLPIGLGLQRALSIAVTKGLSIRAGPGPSIQLPIAAGPALEKAARKHRRRKPCRTFYKAARRILQRDRESGDRRSPGGSTTVDGWAGSISIPIRDWAGLPLERGSLFTYKSSDLLDRETLKASTNLAASIRTQGDRRSPIALDLIAAPIIYILLQRQVGCAYYSLYAIIVYALFYRAATVPEGP